MPQINKRSLSAALFLGVLISFGYAAAQQKSSQRSGGAENVKPQSAQATPQQQYDQLRDQLAQLQTQVKDLQASMDDLRSQQQVIAASAKETHELVLDTRIAQTQGQKDLNSAVTAVGRNERRIDQLDRQISSMMRDLQRVKTKVGLF